MNKVMSVSSLMQQKGMQEARGEDDSRRNMTLVHILHTMSRCLYKSHMMESQHCSTSETPTEQQGGGQRHGPSYPQIKRR